MSAYYLKRSFLLFLLLLSLVSCGKKATPPAPTPAFTPTAAPQPSPSPTSTPLPEKPTLLSIIGKGKVYDTAWSPDRQAFAVSASDALRVYQANTHQVLAEFPPQAWDHLQFSPDGKKLAVIPDGGDILVYDLQARQLVSQVPAGTTLVDFAFKADGSGFAVCKFFFMSLGDPGFSWVEVYALGSDKPKYQFDYDEEYQAKDGGHRYTKAAFSPDGLRLSAADRQTGQVRTWDLATGQLTAFRAPHPQVTVVAYSPDGRWLASVGADSQVRLWNIRTGSLARALSVSAKSIQGLSFYADSARLAVEATVDTAAGNAAEAGAGTADASASTTVTFDVLTGQKIDVPPAPPAPDEIRPFLAGLGYMDINSLPTFSPDGRTLAFQNGDQVVLWDLQAQRRQAVLNTRMDYGAVFTPDGKALAVPQPNGSVELWDSASGQKLTNIPSRKAKTLAFSVDGKSLAVGGEQAVELWDVPSGLRRWQTYASGLSIRAVGFSPDGQTVLAAASSGWAVLWLDARDGQVRQTFQPNTSDPGSVTIAFQGRLLAAVKPREAGNQAVSLENRYQAVRVWDLSTGQVFKDIDGYKNKLYADYLSSARTAA